MARADPAALEGCVRALPFLAPEAWGTSRRWHLRHALAVLAPVAPTAAARLDALAPLLRVGA